MERLKHLEGIKLVSFDIWQTLLTSNPDYKVARATALRSHLGALDVDLDSFIQIIKTVDEEVDAISDATGVQHGLPERVKRIWEKLSDGKRIDKLTDSLIAEFELIGDKLVIENLPRIIEADLLKTLELIQEQGVRMAVMSNTGFISGRQMRLVLEQLGILPFISVQLFSNEVGVSKPNKLIFEALVERSGLDGSMILHVGDNFKADYQGARNAGINAVLLSKTADGSTPDSERVSQLSELVL